MTPRTTAASEGQVSLGHAPVVQIANPGIAHATQPGLFDDLPEAILTVDHRTLIDARVGDRMLLCLSPEISPSAIKVAAAPVLQRRIGE